MNIFYISICAVIILFAFIGFKAGFIKTIIIISQIITAIIAAYFLYPSAANLIKEFFLLTEPVLSPVAFSITFIVLFSILLLLFIPFKRNLYSLHQSSINKITGILPGIFMGFMATIILVRYCLPVMILNGTIQKEIEQSDISAIIKPSAGWMESKISQIIKHPVTQATAAANENTFSEEAVNLSFATDVYATRPDMEKEMLQLINQEREKYGLKSLISDPELTIVAREHSADMFKRGYFSHITPDGINPFERMHLANINYLVAGENLALSQTLSLAHYGLMKSPGHRANILNPKYRRIGIGILDSDSHGLMISQEFRN